MGGLVRPIAALRCVAAAHAQRAEGMLTRLRWEGRSAGPDNALCVTWVTGWAESGTTLLPLISPVNINPRCAHDGARRVLSALTERCDERDLLNKVTTVELELKRIAHAGLAYEAVTVRSAEHKQAVDALRRKRD